MQHDHHSHAHANGYAKAEYPRAIEQLRHALQHLDPKDRAIRSHVAAGLKASFGDSGTAIFQEWCKFDIDDHDMWLEWEDVETRPGIRISSVLELAREAGWDGKVSGGTQEAPTHEPIECVDAADLLKRTPPERIWQVLDRIPGDDVTLLNGDGGEGKTTLALQLAFCTTVGFPWIGHEVRQGPAIYFSAEEPIGELHYRLEKLNRAVQTAEARRDRLTLISRAGKDSVLATFRNGIAVPSALLLELVAIVRREQPVLLVLDAAADVFGGDEIRRSDVRAFINLLRGQLALPNKCAVVLLGHPSREGIKTGDGYSGSTHWNNSVRGRLYLTSLKDGDADVRVLEVMKNNRGKRGEKAHLRWSDGFFTTLTDINAVDAATKAKAKSVMLDLVGRYEKQGRSVNANPSSTRHYYAPVVLAADPAAEGITEELFKLAMKELLHENRLTQITGGPPSKPRSKLIVVRPT